MNKVGKHKTHLDIEENRLYSMTFRMRYERDFLKQLIYMYIRLFIPYYYYSRGKSVIIKRNVFDVWRLCYSMPIPVMLNF